MAGLHDISPMVSTLWVTSATLAPMRAAAAAASTPAWPPPMTMTSNAFMGRYVSYFSGFASKRDRGMVAINVSRETSRRLNQKNVFHVKHWGRLFTNTELAEDFSQNILHPDAAGHPSKRPGRQPQVFGQQGRVGLRQILAIETVQGFKPFP